MAETPLSDSSQNSSPPDWVAIESFANIDLDKYTITTTKTFDGYRLTLYVTKNLSFAYLLLEGSVKQATLDKVEELCGRSSIPPRDDWKGLTQEYIANEGKKNGKQVALLIAIGRNPVNGKNSIVEWHVEEPSSPRVGSDDGKKINYRERMRYIHVQEGQKILTVSPPTQGEPGRDVKGRTLPATDGEWKRPLAGENVRAENNQLEMYAGVDGLIEFDGERVHIRRVLKVIDVNFDTGNIRYDGDVQIEGKVQEGFTVEAQGSVSIEGDLEAANVLAKRVHVHGNTRGGSSIVSQTSIEVRRIESALCRAEKDVTVLEDAVNLNVFCGGRLHLPKGTLAGGKIHALKGAEVLHLGGRHGDATKIIVAPDSCELPSLDHVNATLQDRKEKLERIRGPLGPLKDNPKLVEQLPAGRKEAVKKLLSACSQLEFDLDVYMAERNKILAPLIENLLPTVKVLGSISKGVSFNLLGISWVCPETKKGEFKITLNRAKDAILCEEV